VQARRTIAFSASDARSAPPSSLTCRIKRSRKRRAQMVRPSVGLGSTCRPFDSLDLPIGFASSLRLLVGTLFSPVSRASATATTLGRKLSQSLVRNLAVTVKPWNNWIKPERFMITNQIHRVIETESCEIELSITTDGCLGYYLNRYRVGV
jgi:hypothetical protein